MADDRPLNSQTAALRARRDRLLGPAYRLFYDEPLHVVRGEGVWLTGADGERYLDAYNNVASVGHCHPHVVGALARQAAVLNTHTRYLSEGVLDYAERLLATFPPEIGHVMFTCTGSEANDLALRVARTVTGGTGVIVTDWAYHGVTVALAEMSPSLGSAVRIGDHVRLVAPPDAYREPGDVGQAFAARVTAAIEDMRQSGIIPAALLVDTIFSSDGVFAEPAGFLAPAAAAMRAAGGLVIADEVQPGFGRTGGMWGFARHGFVPDMVTMGKPMGDGHPIAGMAARPEVLAEFGRRTRYFNTFGGNPVSAAVGMAVLDVIEGEGLVANARDTGAFLAEALRALANRHAAIGDVRGAGLFLGVELVRDRATREPDGALASRVVNGLRRRRVLVSSCGRNGNVLKLRPPLVFGREHAEILVDALDRALADPDGA